MAVEALVGSIVETLVSLAADSVAGQLRVAWGLEGELRKLQRLLLRIQSMLADAEEKQTVDVAVRSWLDALKKVAYEAEDVLDDLNYETLRHKAAEVAGDKTPCAGKVCDFFSSHNPVLIRLNMGRRLNDLFEEIDKIAAESTKFNFTQVDHAQSETAAPVVDETCSFVKESEVVGRHREKDEIVKVLINSKHCNAENVAVLPIVGMGGLGKTTMAQLIYNDLRVVGYFQLRVWVCISDHWDTKKIIKEILSLATTKKYESPSMEELHLALHEALTLKRFLIVLDDVWEEDPSKWDTLKGILDYGGKGSVVIVTTRSERVAEITGTLQSCRPPYLSDDESWDLFSKRAFGHEAEKPKELVEIGKAIAKKCGGLPLALRMIGSLLFMKRDRSLWLKIKENSIWDIETDILPALWLSYKHLPSHSKRCFTFCATFPKDCNMSKNMLIYMWMAHGFIPANGGKLEVKGNDIFNQLVQRSFLQEFKADMSHIGIYITRSTYKVHDLVHDLAQYIVGNECLALLLEQSPEVTAVPKNAYHLSISGGKLDIGNTLKASPNLRTMFSFFNINDDMNMNCSRSTSLRVLSLFNYRFPTSMKFLQHLRYLKLFSYSLSELPESVCTLLNLQTLDLCGCVNLLYLPERMTCMISLRHLYLDENCKLSKMPPGMGRMTNMQLLTLYVVSEEIGRGIGELKEMHLSSQLKLKNLGSVKDAKEAREINLHSKDITFLSLGWTGGEINNVERVLEELKPPSCLKFLEILNYDGLNFPKWMSDKLLLQHLVQLTLAHCTGLHQLPPLWRLNSLEKLSLKHMDNLKYIASDNDTTGQAFCSLKGLELVHLRSLEDWWEKRNAAAICFPALVSLTIRECPQMACSLPLAPCLKWLVLDSSKKISLGSINALTSLVSIEIVNHWEKEHVHDPTDSFLHHETVVLSHLQCLEELTIDGCDGLSLAWWHEDEQEESSGHSSLRDLTLNECDWIFSSPKCSGFWTSLASLDSLTIYKCHAVVAFPYQVLQGLKSLRSLDISDCENMTAELSAAMDASILPQLEELTFKSCSRLETVPPIWGPSLKELKLSRCPNLVSLAPAPTAAEQELGRLKSLESIIIKYCPRLKSLPSGMDSLTSLSSLTLKDCTDLTSLPEGLLPTLKKLVVRKCPLLEKKCARGGEYWSLVSNIPDCEIKAE